MTPIPKVDTCLKPKKNTISKGFSKDASQLIKSTQNHQNSTSKTQMHKRGKHVRIHFKEHGSSMEDLTIQVFNTQVSQSV